MTNVIEFVSMDPDSNQLAVVISDYENVVLKLTDSIGRIVYQKNVVASNTLLPTETLKNGLYILAADKNGAIETRKIILN